jgi:uncharacterized protein YbbK (DUF523 family)
MIIASACLLGVNCRYDGSNKSSPRLLDLVRKHTIIPLCPEQLGGLPTPRKGAIIEGGDGFDVFNSQARVVDMGGNDVTTQFTRGAGEVLRIMRLVGAEAAILKDKSPSCGVNYIYGDFGLGLREGVGVLTALLIRNGIRVNSEYNIFID